EEVAEEGAPCLAVLIDGERHAAFSQETRSGAPRVDEEREGRDEALARALAAPRRGLEPGAVLLADPAHHRGQAGALSREVVLDRRLGHRGMARDVVERGAAHAARAPEPIRGLEHSLTRR